MHAPIVRWQYAESLVGFLARDSDAILGALTASSSFAVEPTQRDAWLTQIVALKALQLPPERLVGAHVYFEYTVPRLGRRIDVVLLAGCVLFVLEFKAGEASFPRIALDQVWDYALDLKYFHETSHALCMVPVLVSTAASPQTIRLVETRHGDRLTRPVCANGEQIQAVIEAGLDHFADHAIKASAWEAGRYLPTPTIIEAARALYAGHAVDEISRSDAGARNLQQTAVAVERIIDETRRNGRKAICFVTGVPGAGKTLIGLDLANRHLDPDSTSYSVFLSGNGPLVAVLREALARDRVSRSRAKGVIETKKHARKEVEAFIQNVHHFRDDCLIDPRAPVEHVVLFDEAQRAWNIAQTSAFMYRKKGRPGFDRSEPAFLMSCMDRHEDWAVVVCLVGSGQEINTGEAGIAEWLDAVLTHFPDWHTHLSPAMLEEEYRCRDRVEQVLARPGGHASPDLHLSTSMRSFRAESLSRFVRQVLDLEHYQAQQTLDALRPRYPIVLTRNLDRARTWLREQARGSERYGLVVSSQAQRLKPHAIDVRVKTDPVHWFLADKSDTRSSWYLEDAATEFQVQGLELDWAGVVWDGDLRRSQGGWSHHAFKGSRWQRINKPERQRYLENAYRVLLTRARQGMVLVVPNGNMHDPTRTAGFYDPTYHYLHSLGLQEI